MADVVGEVWSELDHRLINDSLGDIKRAINIGAVMSSIDNILRISPGERVMRPEFGSSLKALLFENMDDTIMGLISRQIKNDIEIWEDRITVVEIDLFTEPDKNSISIAIMFVIKGYNKIFKYEQSIGGEL